MKTLNFPVNSAEDLKNFSVGDEVKIEGIIYTARDRVHDLTAKGEAEWPFNLKSNALFYCGPTPRPEGAVFGSCGPTTSGRMDIYTPALYKKGLAATIGKGPRRPEVVRAIKKYGGIYLAAYGGCGALYSSTVKSAEIIGFKELGPQAVYRLAVAEFPAVVGIDSSGGNIFKR